MWLTLTLLVVAAGLMVWAATALDKGNKNKAAKLFIFGLIAVGIALAGAGDDIPQPETVIIERAR